MPKYRSKPPHPPTPEERKTIANFTEQNSSFLQFVVQLFIPDYMDAEDLLQDCLYRLLCNATVFHNLSEDERKAYVFPIIEGLCIDAYRKRKVISIESLKEDYKSRSDRIEDSPGSDLHLSLIILSESLSDKEWALLKGTYLDGKSAEELAYELNCGESSIRSMLSRARKKARIILEKTYERGKRI